MVSTYWPVDEKHQLINLVDRHSENGLREVSPRPLCHTAKSSGKEETTTHYLKGTICFASCFLLFVRLSSTLPFMFHLL